MNKRQHQSKHNYGGLPLTLSQQLKTYGIHHLRSALASLGHIKHTGISSLLLVSVIGIALALPLAGYVALHNIQAATQNLDDLTQLSLYLQPTTDELATETLLSDLTADPRINHTEFISPNEGLVTLQSSLGISHILDAIGPTDNPLPAVIVITPSPRLAPPALAQLQSELGTNPQIEQVQLDLAWIERLHALINLAERVFLLIALTLAIAVLVIVSTTIRMSIFQHRQAIEIMQLVGATNGFIRRFFLYLGLWYGLLGSIIALFIVILGLQWLSSPVANLATAYHTSIQLQGLTGREILYLGIIALLLSILGAWFAVNLQLRQLAKRN